METRSINLLTLANAVVEEVVAWVYANTRDDVQAEYLCPEALFFIGSKAVPATVKWPEVIELSERLESDDAKLALRMLALLNEYHFSRVYGAIQGLWNMPNIYDAVNSFPVILIEIMLESMVDCDLGIDQFREKIIKLFGTVTSE